MKKLALALALVMVLLLLFCSLGSAAEERLKISKVNPSDSIEPAEPANDKVISLDEAKSRSGGDNTSSNPASGGVISLSDAKNRTAEYNTSSETPANTESTTKTENVDSNNILSEAVSRGQGMFVRSLVDGMYKDFETSNITKDYGSIRGAITTVITFVPNPYEDPTIQDLYKNYNNLAIFFVILFILGEFLNRRAAQIKVTSSVFGEKDLSQARFIGGICMCMLALAANIIFMFALDITEALSKFAVMPSVDAIAPGPENLVLYVLMAVCDLLVFGFFAFRYYVIYAVAVLCSVIAVMLVPDVTREFALDAIEKIVRILAMQPAAIFFSVIGIHASKSLPGPLEPFGYIGLTAVVFCVCWYCLFGNFTLLKQTISFAVKKGVVKV